MKIFIFLKNAVSATPTGNRGEVKDAIESSDNGSNSNVLLKRINAWKKQEWCKGSKRRVHARRIALLVEKLKESHCSH